jgi:membrane protein
MARETGVGTRPGAGSPAPRKAVLRRLAAVLAEALTIFMRKNALSRSAAIAFYTVTSMAPVLLVTIAIAGYVFDDEAARALIFAQFESLLGSQVADFLDEVIASASREESGTLAGIIGIATLIVGASGVFVELRDALNDAWGTEPEKLLSKIIRARLGSLGLVLALGFVLVVSLAIDAALIGFAESIDADWPFGSAILMAANVIVSLALIATLFAAIYKILPARPLTWRDVAFGAIVTAILMEVGKLLIGLYLGNKSGDSSVSAAGSMVALLAWVYYSAAIVLFGAALTRARYVQVRADAQ